MIDYPNELRSVVDATCKQLSSLSRERAEERASATSWSIKEVVGHLIDSASNNHQRFVRARWKNDLVFEGYQQDAWIAAQDYQGAPFEELLELWRLFNRHIARVMDATPDSIRLTEHRVHNFHEIAWRAVPQTKPVTLDYFMRDYVDHLKHHVRQIQSILMKSDDNA
jgi:hypothetical protein